MYFNVFKTKSSWTVKRHRTSKKNGQDLLFKLEVICRFTYVINVYILDISILDVYIYIHNNCITSVRSI